MNSPGGITRQISTGPAPAPPARPAGGPAATLPAAEQTALVTAVLQDYPGWSVFWDKRHRLWRAAEDDPGSELYAASSDVQAIISYIAARS